MPITDLPERLLQRAVHTALAANTSTHRLCTNGDQVQVVASGLPNIHAGPDFQDMAVLHDGVVYVGDGEFHRRTSDWHVHAHTGNERYQDLLLHLVLEDDKPDDSIARWTMVIPDEDIKTALSTWRSKRRLTHVEVEELQHFALLRLLRLTADAQALIRRMGVYEALRAMTSSWFTRLTMKSRRPVDASAYTEIRNAIGTSELGQLVLRLREVPAIELVALIDRTEHQRIAREGVATRRELLVNVIIPMMCANATHDQRVMLLQWYWGAKAAHTYGLIQRKFRDQPQEYVWEQQGMLEYLRHHGRRVSTCGEAIRAYGVAGALEFLRASS